MHLTTQIRVYIKNQKAEGFAYNPLLSSQLIYAPHVGWTQDMPEATHAQAPLCKDLPVTVHNDVDILGAANGFKPFVRGGLIAVGDGGEMDGRVGGCRFAEG